MAQRHAARLNAGDRGAIAAIAIALCACAAGCAALRDDDGVRDVRAQPLEPYGTTEQCVRLADGDRLDYAWSSDMPLDFDIHYRDGGARVEPVSRSGVTHDADVYAPLLAENYCLGWEAGPAGAHLDYRVRVQRAQR